MSQPEIKLGVPSQSSPARSESAEPASQPEIKLSVVVAVSPEHYVRLARMAHQINMSIEQYLGAQVECFAAALGAVPEISAEEARATA